MEFKKHNTYRILIFVTIVVWFFSVRVAADGLITSEVAIMISAVAFLLTAPALAGILSVGCLLGSELMPKARQTFLNVGLVTGQFTIVLDKVLSVIPGNPYAWGRAAHLWEMSLVVLLKDSHDDGIELLETCLKLAEEQEGAESAAVLETLTLLTGAYRNRGRFEESEKAGLRSIAILEKRGPTAAVNVGTIYADLCVTYSRQGRIKEAEVTGERATEILFGAADGEIPGKEGLIGIALNNLACVYDDACQYDRAFEIYKRALDLKIRALQEGDPSIGVAHCNMAFILCILNRYEEALEHANKSKQGLEVAGDRDSKHWADTIRNIGIAERGLGKFDDAEKHQLESQKYYEKNLQSNHPSLGECYRELGVLYREMNEHYKSRHFFQKSVEVYESAMGKEHPQVLRTLQEFRALLEQVGDDGELAQVNEKISNLSEQR